MNMERSSWRYPLLPYRWPAGKRCAAALSFDFDAEIPFLLRSHPGDPPVVGELELRRFGPHVAVYRILDLLDEWGLKATFFVPGVTAEQFPEPVAEIHRRGQEVALHGYWHRRVDEVSPTEFEEEIVKNQEVLESITGVRAVGYRAPGAEVYADTFQLLNRLGIEYDSSLMHFEHPYWLDGVVEIPMHWVLDDVPFYRYTGNDSGQPAPRNHSDVIDTWRWEYKALKRFGGLWLLTMHPWISGRAGRMLALEQLVREIQNDTEVWFTSCGEIAAYHRATFPDSYRESIEVKTERRARLPERL